jgi:hypothetical protein
MDASSEALATSGGSGDRKRRNRAIAHSDLATELRIDDE